MIYFLGESTIDPTKNENTSQYSDQNNNASLVKNYAIAFLILTLCLLNLKKIISVIQYWHKTRCWLPIWVNGSKTELDRINAAYCDLQTEIRELSEQMNEFKRHSKLNVTESAKSISSSCQIRGQPSIYSQVQMVSKIDRYGPSYGHKEISECNWVGYLNIYVYNPDPRIVDTNELGNMKRNWLQL